MDFYSAEIKDVFLNAGSSKDGLSASEAKARLKRHGFNELVRKKRRTALKIFFEQFRNFLILLLLCASVLAVFLGDYVEAVGMICIAILSAILGFVQEYKAERAMEALKRISAPTGKVVRDGSEKKIPAREIVPGDVIVIESGDIVAADARLFEDSSLQVDEAILTGESVPSPKDTKKLKEGTEITERTNMVFMGTIVTYGKGRGVVTGTGMDTEFGKIALTIEEAEEPKTLLQNKFESLARQIGLVVIVLVGVVFVLGLSFQKEVSIARMLIFSISLAVAAVPTALPAIVTIGLALGASSMAKRNVIIKKLPATESMGSVTVICSDKTGTLTKSQLSATRLFFDGNVIDVSGIGYEPKGEFKHGTEKMDKKSLEFMLRIGYLCNNAKLVEKGGRWDIIGDPTEGALVVLARKGRLDEKALSRRLSVVKELPFSSERKMMTVIAGRKRKPERVCAYVKGAPDVVLKKCARIYDSGRIRSLTKRDRESILSVNESFAEDALRVLGLACRDMPAGGKYEIEGVERDLVFVGLVGMIDAPREEVAAAVKQCEDAGINVIAITGDHPVTAKAVADRIGLLKKDDLVVTGEYIDRLNDSELMEKLGRIRVVARALPGHKLRMVKLLKKQGHVVAMTGDGVNDAPALKTADVGIAMGITGSDVAKEVSKTVLVDDNFASIVNAISEGRNIYDKIIKSSRYLLSCNLGEIITVFLAIMLNLPLPLVPLQILMMNLLTDGLPALGLGMEGAEEDVMKRSPRNPKESLFTNEMLILTLIFGIVMGIGTLFIFNTYLDRGEEVARTAAFTTLVLFEMFAVVGSRSLYPFRKLNIFTNKWLLLGILASVSIQVAIVNWGPLQAIFSTVSLSSSDWLRIVTISSLGFFVMELGKVFVSGLRAGRNAPS
ncbi:cation-translocating P-type ATPase [Candidatus Woesearchaeota archaeon]|nr:cation-translocating P-type ATPase [Candidatus Woesearchaeota archaeon]